MRTTKLSAGIAALSLAALLGMSAVATAKQLHRGAYAQDPGAYAQGTVTYAQAWRICKKFVDAGVWSWDQHGQRYQRGGACMLQLGYPFDSADAGGEN